MRLTTAVSATALLAAFAGGAAHAQEKCFDKGTLSYVDCPQPAPAPEPIPAPQPAPAPFERNGLYIGLRGGVASYDDTEFNTLAFPVENEYDLGYVVGGFIGYEFAEVTPGVDLRSELEIGYQTADVDQHFVLGVPQVDSDGDTSAIFGFLNLYADINLIHRLDLIVGGGLGYGQVELDGHGAGGVVLLDDDDDSFAYHLDAGLGFDVTPDWTVEALYRYSGFFNAEVDAIGGGQADIELDSHQGQIGLRYKF